MGVALNKMVQEDPSFHVSTDEDSGETLIKGMGELHLDIKVDILRRTHLVDVEMGKPQVAYRETITQEVKDSYTHKKQTGLPATLEPMVFPDPVISIAITPKDKAGTEKMGVALNKMVQEDPSFHVATDEDSGETLIKGMGELHLDIKVDILRRNSD